VQRLKEEVGELHAAVEKLTEKVESTQAERRAAQDALAAANAMAKSREAAAGEQGATMAATIAQLQRQLEDERLKACSLFSQFFFASTPSRMLNKRVGNLCRLLRVTFRKQDACVMQSCSPAVAFGSSADAPYCICMYLLESSGLG
jgi:predicted RNase H-like nuclease (RuvC/YqgF family)